MLYSRDEWLVGTYATFFLSHFTPFLEQQKSVNSPDFGPWQSLSGSYRWFLFDLLLEVPSIFLSIWLFLVFWLVGQTFFWWQRYNRHYTRFELWWQLQAWFAGFMPINVLYLFAKKPPEEIVRLGQGFFFFVVGYCILVYCLIQEYRRYLRKPKPNNQVLDER